MSEFMVTSYFDDKGIEGIPGFLGGSCHYHLEFQLLMDKINILPTEDKRLGFVDISLFMSKAPIHIASDIRFALKHAKLYFDSETMSICSTGTESDAWITFNSSSFNDQLRARGKFNAKAMYKFLESVHGHDPMRILQAGRKVINLLDKPLIMHPSPDIDLVLHPTEYSDFENQYDRNRDAFVLLSLEHMNCKINHMVPKDRMILYAPDRKYIPYVEQSFTSFQL